MARKPNRGAARRRRKAKARAASEGAIAPEFCPNCTQPVSMLDRFCPACGTILPGGEEE